MLWRSIVEVDAPSNEARLNPGFACDRISKVAEKKMKRYGHVMGRKRDANYVRCHAVRKEMDRKTDKQERGSGEVRGSVPGIIG